MDLPSGRFVDITTTAGGGEVYGERMSLLAISVNCTDSTLLVVQRGVKPPCQNTSSSRFWTGSSGGVRGALTDDDAEVAYIAVASGPSPRRPRRRTAAFAALSRLRRLRRPRRRTRRLRRPAGRSASRWRVLEENDAIIQGGKTPRPGQFFSL